MMKVEFHEDESGSCVQGRLVGGETGEAQPGQEVVIEFRCELMRVLNKMVVGTELMR